jgi:hypothetical protein
LQLENVGNEGFAEGENEAQQMGNERLFQTNSILIHESSWFFYTFDFNHIQLLT